MLWSQIFLIAFLISTPPSTCSCQTGSSLSYRLGPGDIDFGAMQILRASPGQLLILKRPIGADRKQVYVSTDGERWRRAAHQQELAMSHLVIASGAARGKNLYRLLQDDSVLERSDDMGKRWRRTMLRLQPLADLRGTQQRMRLRIVGVNDLTLYANLETKDVTAGREWKALQGVYVSRNGGDDWQVFSKTLVAGSPVSEAGGVVFGIDGTGLVESRDEGQTWSATEIGQHLPAVLPLQDAQNAPVSRRSRNVQIYQMEFEQGNPHSAFLVTNGGLFVTHDNGKKWCLLTFGSDALYTVSSVAIADGSHIFATSTDLLGPKLWESKDGGESFHPVPVKTSNDSVASAQLR